MGMEPVVVSTKKNAPLSISLVGAIASRRSQRKVSSRAKTYEDVCPSVSRKFTKTQNDPRQAKARREKDDGHDHDMRCVLKPRQGQGEYFVKLWYTREQPWTTGHLKKTTTL